MRILLANDDGIFAPGLAALYRELRQLGTVDVVAPATQQSAAAHSITIDLPLICERVHVGNEFHGFAVQGSPADSVKLAIRSLLPERPDLVVSGINHGENVGMHTLYSGTVAAAAEGALLGCPAIAVSLERGNDMDFPRAATIGAQLVRALLGRGIGPRELFSINIPALRPGWPLGVRVCRQSVVPFQDRFEKRQDPYGRQYFWLHGDFGDWRTDAGSDLHAQREGYVSIVPLRFDLTDDRRLEKMRDWPWPELG